MTAARVGISLTLMLVVATFTLNPSEAEYIEEIIHYSLNTPQVHKV